jgi:phage baseplate assembly protein V
MVKFLRDPAHTAGVSDPEASDIDRRAQDVVKFGKIKQVDYTKTPPVYRVAIGDENDEDNYILSDWLPATGARAKGDRDTHFLEVDEKVVMLAEGGELATAQVMPAGTYTPNSDDEKATTDKAGVWNKTFKDGGSISYDRNTHTWNIQGTDEGELTIKAAGCSIHFKGGTMTLKAKNIELQADEKVTVTSDSTSITATTTFESKAANSNHTGTSAVKTIGPTHIGLDEASDSGPLKVLLEGDIPSKQAFSKVG